ncbi:MAG TPA: DNRLRE domain-containing protein [Thermomicrobiales bacterium]|nr:DNRLRE domain-containing protein [Thermomicrobiales bacterium]
MAASSASRQRALRVLLLVMLVGHALVVSVPHRAEAQAAQLVFTPASGPPGAQIDVQGSGFPAATSGQLLWDADGSVLATLLSDATGGFAAAFGVPAVDPGDYPVVAVLGEGDGAVRAQAMLTVEEQPTALSAPTATPSPTPEPAASPTSTVTPVPSPTSMPTFTPVPTITPVPTLTPTATPTATAPPVRAVTPSSAPPPQAAATLAAAQTLTFGAAADAEVRQASPNSNYGTVQTLQVDTSPVVHSYFRFDVTGVSGVVQSAKLRLWVTGGTANGPPVYRVADTSWTETGITWNNKPAATNPTGDKGSISTGTWIEYDVTAFVGGNGVVGFALVPQSSDGLYLNSREATSNRPELVVTMASSPTPTATMTVPPAIPPTATATPGGAGMTTTFGAAADAYVAQDNSNTNYGTAMTLQSDTSPNTQIYLRFDVNTPGGTVQRAILRLWVTNGTTDGPPVSTSSDVTWSENGITWANKPAVTNPTGDKGTVPASAWLEYDVTAIVRANGAYTFALIPQSSDGLYVNSREAGANTPQLVVTTSGGPTPTPTPTPPPRPVNPTFQIGAYYYAWYGGSGRHWSDGYLRHQLTNRQQPALGEYDSRNPATIAQHFQWAQQYGVDYFVCSWWGANGYEDVTIRDNLIQSPAIGSTKIAILYESITLLGLTNGVISFDAAREQKLISDFDYLARTYFSDPRYYKIGGRPVVYLYVTRIYRGNYAQALTDLRSYVRDRYGFELYLVGDEVDWDGSPNRDRIKLFDAITPYTMYSDLQSPGWPDDTKFLDGVRARYDSFRSAAAAEGVGFIPGVIPAFNDRGVRLSVNHYALPHEVNASYADTYTLFSRYLDLAGGYIDPTVNTVTVTSWNEWHEDTQIEPTGAIAASNTPTQYTTGYTYYAYGFKLLDILKAFKLSHATSGAFASSAQPPGGTEPTVLAHGPPFLAAALYTRAPDRRVTGKRARARRKTSR